MDAYEKLVRDNIPDIIAQDGKAANIEIIEDAQRFKELLGAKCVEEAREVEQAKDKEELMKEIADLREVIDTLIKAYEIDESELIKIQNERREKRGGFERRVFLKSIE